MRGIVGCGAFVMAAASFGGSTALAGEPQTAALVREGPVFGYVGRADQAVLHQLTPAQAAAPALGDNKLGPMLVTGAILGMIGPDDVPEGADNPVIQDPSEDLARALAAGLAKAQGGVLASGPIARDEWGGPGRQDAAQAIGARYVVEVAPVTMNLAYFKLDWRHYDLAIDTTAKVIDSVDGHVLSKAKCSIDKDHSAPLVRRNELLANHAEKLRAVVEFKAAACLAKLQSGLDLPMVAAQPAASVPRAPAAEIISAASATCDGEKLRYAAELGVPCASLGSKIALPPKAE